MSESLKTYIKKRYQNKPQNKGDIFWGTFCAAITTNMYCSFGNITAITTS